ncbi:MAG: chorismate synthase [Balneolaceae bacterium]|nr:chorismate synthase [Balneolaceae bacterium]
MKLPFIWRADKHGTVVADEWHPKHKAEILSGVRFGKTLGGPIALQLPNRAFEKDDTGWPKVMNKEGNGKDVDPITVPRPGHADLTGVQKYRYDDIRPAIERSSARETAMRVGLSAIPRKLLKHFGIEIGGHIIRIGSVGYTDEWEDVRSVADPLMKEGAEAIFRSADESPVRCLDEELSEEMREEIKRWRKEGSSLGGHWEVIVTGLPAGLGSFVRIGIGKLEGQLAQAVLGTQAMKGVEIGLGFEAGRRPGHEVHDEIIHEEGEFRRRTNRLGGFEGGVTTGMPLIIRGVMKPIPTMLTPIKTVDMNSKEETDTRYERSDVCALPRAVVVIR